MKRVKQIYLSSIAIAALVFSSCGGLNKMVENATDVSYDVQPSPLETHAGEVEVTINTRFPEKYFNKKAIVEATPVVKYNGGQAEFESTTLQGEKVEANNKVIPYDGGSYSYSGTIPYNEDMLNSELVVEMSARIGDNDPVSIPGVPVANGVIATSTLVQNTPKTIMIGDKYERITPETYEADINYVINRANVRNSELRSEDIKTFEKSIKEATEAERKEFKEATISAYASPDGPYDLNENLSEDRKESAQRYFKRALTQAEVDALENEDFLSLMTTAEDWEGFKELMEKSDIQDKELVLRVLSMYSDPAVREREIKNIAEAFEEIKEEILPPLRRSKMGVTVNVIGLSDEEISDLAQNDPDSLKLEEVLYAATLTDDLNEKLRIYEVAAENYPECVRAHNNVGHVNMKLGNVDAAKNAFEKAQGLRDDQIIKNNLGAVALKQGNISEAENILTAATGAGEEVNFNLGIIKIMQADYSAAVNYFGNKPSFNAALAELLNGNTQKALSTLDEIGETDDAMVYYLKAVAGARAGNTEVVLNNLRTAVGMDSDLKEHVVNDLEFREFVANEAFSEIVR